jgi:hypothetical protein
MRPWCSHNSSLSDIGGLRRISVARYDTLLAATKDYYDGKGALGVGGASDVEGAIAPGPQLPCIGPVAIGQEPYDGA